MQSFLKSLPPYARLFIFIGVAILSVAIVGSIAELILQRALGMKNGLMQWNLNREVGLGDGASPARTYIRWSTVVQFLFFFLLPCYWYARSISKQPARYLLMRRPFSMAFWFLGIAVMLTVIPLSEYLGLLNQKVHFGGLDTQFRNAEEWANTQLRIILSVKGVGQLLINLVLVAGLAGIGEELFFRGVVQRILTEWTRSPWAAIIITGLLFSAIHFQFFGFLPRAVLGIILGILSWYSGSLLVAMMAHFVYDALGLIMIYFNPDMLANADQPMLKQDETTMLYLAIGSLIITVTLVMRMKSLSKSSLSMLKENESPTQSRGSWQ